MKKIYFDLKKKIEKVLASRSVNWQVREKLKQGKSCPCCKHYGGDIFCLYEMHEGNAEMPDSINMDLITCDHWKKSKITRA